MPGMCAGIHDFRSIGIKDVRWHTQLEFTRVAQSAFWDDKAGHDELNAAEDKMLGTRPGIMQNVVGPGRLLSPEQPAP